MPLAAQQRTLLTAQRRAVFEALRAAGIGVNVHYMPVHLQPDYLKLGFTAGDFPIAEAYYARAITLPLYPDLSDKDQQFIVTTLKAALQKSDALCLTP